MEKPLNSYLFNPTLQEMKQFLEYYDITVTNSRVYITDGYLKILLKTYNKGKLKLTFYATYNNLMEKYTLQFDSVLGFSDDDYSLTDWVDHRKHMIKLEWSEL